MYRPLALLLIACTTAAAAPPQPSDDKLLFEGPAAGEVAFIRPLDRGITKRKGTILYVTSEAVFLRLESGAVEVIDASRYTIDDARTTVDGKLLKWASDPATKKVVGFTAPPRGVTLPATSVGQSSEAKYLFFALDRLQERIDQAIVGNDVQQLKTLRERAMDLREHAAKVPGAGPVVGLFDGLTSYIDEQTKLWTTRAEFLDKHMEKVEANTIKDREAKFRSESTKLQGLAEYYKGALPRINIGTGGWRGRGWASASYDLGGAMAGVTNIIRGEQQYEMDRLQIKFAGDLLDKEKGKTLTGYADRQTELRLKRRQEVAEVGTSFGMPRAKDAVEARELSSMFQSKGDFRSLLNLLEQRTGSEKKADNSPNPFTLLDAYHTAAMLKEENPAKQADKLFDLAKRGVEAMQYVPPGAIYDADRADVLQSAASLACMAAMLDAHQGAWKNAYSAKAAFAVRVLEQAKGYTLDKGGELREQHAVALVLAGRHADALALSEEIKGLRDGSVGFLLTMVRLLAMNGRGKDGLAALEDAITKRGFRDVQFISKNDDYTALRADSDKFRALAVPQVTIVHVRPKAQGSKHRFEITNDSAFTLTDVRVQVTLNVAGGSKVYRASVPQLDKGEMFELSDTTELRVSSAQMRIETDQGNIGPIFKFTSK